MRKKAMNEAQLEVMGCWKIKRKGAETQQEFKR
jgi:hypothetical protein